MFGWLAAVAALLGFHAADSLPSGAGDPIGERLGYFLEPDALAVFGVEGVVLGTAAFAGEGS